MFLILAEHLGNISSFIPYNKLQKYIISIAQMSKLKFINAILSKNIQWIGICYFLYLFYFYLYVCLCMYTYMQVPVGARREHQNYRCLEVQEAPLIDEALVQSFLARVIYILYLISRPTLLLLRPTNLHLYLWSYQLFCFVRFFFILHTNTRIHYMTCLSTYGGSLTSAIHQ